MPNNTTLNFPIHNNLVRVVCTRLFNQTPEIKEYHVTETYLAISKIFGTINFAAILPTVVANLSVLLAILKTQSIQSISNTILLSIVVDNLIQGLFSFPSYGVVIFSTAKGEYNCTSTEIFGYVGGSLACVSMLTVMLLAYERYVALFNSLRYDSKFTYARLKSAIASIWIFAFILFFFLTFINATRVFAVSFVSFITVSCYVFNVILHIKMFRVIRNLRQQQLSMTVGGPDTAKEQRIKERRTAKFAAYVICFLLVCYLPVLIKQILTSVLGESSIIDYICNTILLLHATFSPFLYAWQSPPIYRAVKKLWRCQGINSIGQGERRVDTRETESKVGPDVKECVKDAWR